MNDNETRDLVAELERAIGAEQVKFDTMTRLLYSTDASNYQIMPIGVTFPRSADDVVAIHEIATRRKTPILPRGGGTSLAGQTVGQALVMDFSRHMRRVRSINAETHCASVESGLVLDHLNRQLAPLKLMYGPDPATADRATFGGIIGNNSTGSHSILYGMSADHVRRLEVVFASGERTWLDANTPLLKRLRAEVSGLITAHQDDIKARYPKTWRTVAGYALNKIDPQNVNLNWLLTGSEGTLATIVQAEINLVAQPAMRCLALVHFDSLHASLEATPRILETKPSAVELIDRFMLNLTRQNPEYVQYLTFVEGDPAVILIVEFYGDSAAELQAQVANLRNLLTRIGHRGPIAEAFTARAQLDVWTIRKAALGIVMSERGDTKSLNFVEDAAVPVDQLADYIDDVEKLIHGEGTTFAIYAHASAGCLHVQPLVNLKTPEGYRQYRNIASGVADLVVKYCGTTSGEHGEGLARGEFSERLFGSKLVEAFRQVKRAFDPDNLMNPGKMFGAGRMDDPALMRYSPAYTVLPVQTRFDWSADGGLNGAAELCNGTGACRKEGTGTMCPSYMATRDEYDVTRGRANALRLAMSGHLPDGLASDALHRVFELCLSCKACKAECPSSVDVARMKAEFLASYQDAHGTSLSTQVFANIHRLNALGSLVPAISNFALSSKVGHAAFRLIGVPTERPLPPLARHRFSRIAPRPTGTPWATLVVDTFTEFNHPQVGAALLKIADALAIRLKVIRLPGQGCCGRPAISKGVLDLAKNMANQNVRELGQQLDSGAPFIFLEPSCLSAFADDYLTLVDPALRETARRLSARCMSAESWLVEQLAERQPTWKQEPREILLHGHCHQKALWGTADTLRLLRHIPGAQVTEIDSGCCGVAGSFGYEHYELSLKIANQRLLPAIAAKPGALVAAPGTSCRTQIGEAGYQVWHPVEIIAAAIE
jgi:FAD/FMN-containing dehydrogenase/Fe-S oxidoreductase